MIVPTRSRSPVPPRAPSPNLARPSTSSNRSVRRTGADFEAALLKPTDTIFLSGSPSLGQELSTATPIRVVDHDAPQPIEKRSFEEDLTRLTVTPVKKFGVIPPTPSPILSERRTSAVTTGSELSATPSRVSIAGPKKVIGQSLGIDGGSFLGRMGVMF